MDLLKLDPASSTLIVVDMQNDFCNEKGYHASIGKPIGSVTKIIPNIQLLIQAFHEFTRPVIHVTQIYEKDGSDSPHTRHKILPQFAQARRESIIAVRDTWGAAVIDELKPSPTDYTVKKRRFSGFYNTDLETILECKNTKTIIFTGAVTYVCVEHTARDAFIRDYDVVVADDAVAGWNEEMHKNALRSMAWSTAAVISTAEILKALKSERVS